jgi:hypothetical protein
MSQQAEVIPLTMDYHSQLAEVSRAFILDYPNKLRQYSIRGASENYRLRGEYHKHMRFFVDYWYNHAHAGIWFDAPFLESAEPEPENPEIKPVKTIPSPGKKISKNLYEIVNSEETEGIIIEAEYDAPMTDSENDSD